VGVDKRPYVRHVGLTSDEIAQMLT